MVCRPKNLIFRALRLAPLVTCVFSGCTCSGGLWSTPTPTATATATRRPTQTPTQVVRPTDSPTPPPTPDAAATATVTAKRAACDRYVALLSGREQDDALLNNPEVQALAQQSPDLATCGAVARDSDERCQRLMPAEHGPGMQCRQMRSIFHELRTYPKGRSFLFSELDLEECRSIPGLTPTACEALLDALRSADDSKCAATGAGQGICRAYVHLDKSLCRGMPEVQRQLKQAPKAGIKAEPEFRFEDACKSTIESRGFLAQGLNTLAQSGPARERELAKAALGQADACAGYEETARQVCMGSAPVPPPGAPAANTPVPATP